MNFLTFDKFFLIAFEVLLLIIATMFTIFLILQFGIYFWSLFSKKKYSAPRWELDEFSFSHLRFKKVGRKEEIRCAWKSLTSIMTKVIVNTFDEYGNEKKVLDSIFTLFKDLRTNLLEYIAPFSAGIIYSLSNRELRPFLAKWDSYLNEKGVLDDANDPQYESFRREFKEDFIKLFVSIEEGKYVERLGEICNLKINRWDHTGKSNNILRLKRKRD